MKKIEKVTIICEECGTIGELVGDSDTIHYALSNYYEEHAADVHGPSLRYDWSDYETH